MERKSNIQYRSDKTKKTHALDSFVFNYSNMFNAIDMIKVEINYMNRIHLFECEKRTITLQLKDKVEVFVLNKLELFASKVNALINRTTIRDIYDVNNMIINKTIENDEFNLFKKCVIFYSLLSSQYFLITPYASWTPSSPARDRSIQPFSLSFK